MKFSIAPLSLFLTVASTISSSVDAGGLRNLNRDVVGDLVTWTNMVGERLQESLIARLWTNAFEVGSLIAIPTQLTVEIQTNVAGKHPPANLGP